MKLKKSSGSKMNKAREEIADQVRPDRSNTRTIGMVVGSILALGAIIYAITMFGASEEEM